MAAHYVTCPICGQRFNRDAVPCVQVAAKRWAHVECYNSKETEKSKDQLDKEDLEKYIMMLLKEDFVNPKVRKQLKQFTEEYNYTYSGIKKALVYFYEVKQNDTDKMCGGIGIVPHIYKQAKDYYYALWLASQKNEGKVISDYKPVTREVHIPVPQASMKRRKLFAFFSKEEENE